MHCKPIIQSIILINYKTVNDFALEYLIDPKVQLNQL